MIREDKREQERRKRRRKKLKQAQLKPAKRGIISCVCAGISFALIALLLLVAYRQRGTAATYIGGLGLVALVLAGTGFYMGHRGLKERNKSYLTCKIGMAACGILTLGFISLFCRGLF